MLHVKTFWKWNHIFSTKLKQVIAIKMIKNNKLSILHHYKVIIQAIYNDENNFENIKHIYKINLHTRLDFQDFSWCTLNGFYYSLQILLPSSSVLCSGFVIKTRINHSYFLITKIAKPHWNKNRKKKMLEEYIFIDVVRQFVYYLMVFTFMWIVPEYLKKYEVLMRYW